MVTFLYVMGKLMMACSPGLGCVDIIGDPALIISIGGFEFITEFMGIKIYKRIQGISGKDNGDFNQKDTDE